MNRSSWPRWIVIVAGVLVLIFANINIYQRQQLLVQGRLVLLPLAPVDPRSLMQGDYMALRYQLEDEVDLASADQAERDGLLVLSLDADNVAQFSRTHQGETLQDHEVLMRYRIRNDKLRLASHSFFFQEGTSESYQAAQYGAFRVSPSGDALLVDLYDENTQTIRPSSP